MSDPALYEVVCRYVLVAFCAGVATRRVVLEPVVLRNVASNCMWKNARALITSLAVLTAGMGIFWPTFAGLAAILLSVCMFAWDRHVLSLRSQSKQLPVWRPRKVQSDH